MVEQAALLVFTFLGTTLILIPTVFHIQNRNVAVVCLCLWLSIYNGITFINGIVWNEEITDQSPIGQGYCDISSRIQLTSQAALMGCAIAILRFLASILSSKGLATNMRSSKLRQDSIDLALIFVVPALILVMQLIVYRNARYTIVQFYGCSLNLVTPNTMYMLFMHIWSPLLACGAIFYALSIILALNRKRNDFRQVLKNSNAGLDLSRFLRLFILAIMAIFVIAPTIFYQFWGQVHYLSRKSQMPRGHYTDILFLYDVPSSKQLWAQWFSAAISIVFAGLFGIGREARNNYTKWISKVPGSERLLKYGSQMSSSVSRSWSERGSKRLHGFANGNSCSDASTLLADMASQPEMSSIHVTTKTTSIISS